MRVYNVMKTFKGYRGGPKDLERKAFIPLESVVCYIFVENVIRLMMSVTSIVTYGWDAHSKFGLAIDDL